MFGSETGKLTWHRHPSHRRLSLDVWGYDRCLGAKAAWQALWTRQQLISIWFTCLSPIVSIEITHYRTKVYTYVCMCMCWKKIMYNYNYVLMISSTVHVGFTDVRHFMTLAKQSSTWRASTLTVPYMYCWFIERTVEWCMCLSLLDDENGCNRYISYCSSDIYMVLSLYIE